MSSSSSITEKIKILLISSQEYLAVSIEDYLKTHSDEIDYLGCAKTGQEGISKAQTLDPHLVLITNLMPDMHTIEVVRSIRATSESIKIMTMSESNNPQWIFRTIDAGADDYISQPSAGPWGKDYILLDNMYEAIKKLYYHIGISLREDMNVRKGLQ